MSSPEFAVIGHPISQSLSPQIHKAFASQFDIDLDYQRIEAEPGNFQEQVNHFFVNSGRGLNVTAPLKELAFECSDLLTDRALVAGAVNTLKFFENDILLGDNTDGIGLVTDLAENQACTIEDRHVLVLGAGGAVRGCLGALLAQSPATLYLHNRTHAKAEVLQEEFAEFGKIQLLPETYLAELEFDLVVNGTSASLGDARPAIDHRYLRNAHCYDMMFGDKSLAFTKWALASGAGSASDGLGMLVEQAAESFYVWHELRPQTAPVLEQLRSSATKSR